MTPHHGNRTVGLSRPTHFRPTQHGTPPSRRGGSAVRRAVCEMSPLENRQLMSMSIGGDGYTTFGPSADTQIWYVSDSLGSDFNPGTQAQPFKTVSKGKSQLRDGKPDWLLLKRGDTFNEVFGNWTRSGRAADEPMLLGAWGSGSDRPTLRTNGLDADGITLAGGTTAQLRYLAIQGLRFTDNTHNGTEDKYGIRLQRPGTGFYIEDVQVDNFKDGIVIGQEKPNPGVNNVTIRRSLIIDNWQKRSGGHSQGLYASGTTNGLTIEENVFDHNGWKEGVAGAEKTQFNHNMYINYGAQNVVIRNNISTRASLRGILSRGGGIITGNVTARNAQGIETWGNATISNNVVLENGDIPNFPQGFGIQVVNQSTTPGGHATITDNIIAHDWSNFTYNVFGIRVWYGMDSAEVKNNITYDWRRPYFYSNSGSVDVDVHNNQFQIDDDFHGVVVHNGPTGANNFSYHDNTYYSPRAQPFWYGTQFKTFSSWQFDPGDSGSTVQRKNYLDPNRELGAYNQFLGGGNSFDAFIANARLMSRANYNPNYTAAPVISFIRQGFNLGSGVGTQVYVVPTDSDVAEPSTANPMANPGQFTVFRTGPVTSALTVNYTISGTATYGTDFSATVPISGQITFPVGAASILVNVTPNGDSAAEDPESVEFRINSGAGYDPGAPAIADFSITDGNGGTVIPPIDPTGGNNGGGTIDVPFDPITAGTGLRGAYYGDINFSDFITDRLDPQVNFDYQLSAPAGVSTDPDSFSAVWTGYVITDIDGGDTEFHVNADDGVRLYVNDLLVIDTLSTDRFPGDANSDGAVNLDDFTILAANFGQLNRDFSQGDFDGDTTVNLDDFTTLASRFGQTAPPPNAGLSRGSTFLTRNLRYDIRLEYVEYGGTANVQLWWTQPGEQEEIVPMANLFPPDDYTGSRSSLASGSLPPAALPPSTMSAAMFSRTRIADDLQDQTSAMPA